VPLPRKFVINGVESEEEIITDQDRMDIAHPMVSVDGVKRVACTQCHQRPLVRARLCQECYDERMRVADWRAKLSIVKHGKGRPKLMCPWCNTVGLSTLGDWCCGNMQRAVFEIAEQEQARQHSDDIYSPLGIKPL
jgi:hypothetical protein